MLLRLPAHVRGMAKEWVAALWGADLLYVTDGSTEGRRDAAKEAVERGGEVKVLPLLGLSVAVKKKPP